MAAAAESTEFWSALNVAFHCFASLVSHASGATDEAGAVVVEVGAEEGELQPAAKIPTHVIAVATKSASGVVRTSTR